MTKAANKVKRRRKRRKVVVLTPGMQSLPEDIFRSGGNGVFCLKRHPRSKPGPVKKTQDEFLPLYEVEDRLMTAMKTIRALPDKEYSYLIVKSASIPFVQEYMDAYNSADIQVPRFKPNPSDVSDCLTALSWARHVDKRIWKILWLRSFGFSFGIIGKYIGRSDETARVRYKEGITDAWSAANGVR